MIKKLLTLLLLSLSLLASEAVLAVQWFPSVCKVKRYKACRKPLPFWMNNFTLHGLWPKKTYCKVDARSKMLDKKRQWDKIPLKLDPSLEELLFTYMPGYVSGLHKHEWVKHGTCYSKSPETYFLDSIALVSQLNESEVRDFFLENRGKRVQTYKVRQAFDRAFFKGAGKRVKFICEKGYLVEMRINLKGRISPETSLYDLLKRARKASLGCKRGMIAR